jgi:hypothetical protein
MSCPLASRHVWIEPLTEVGRRRRFGLAPKSGPKADIAARQLRAISLQGAFLRRLSVRRGWRLTVIVRAAHAWCGILIQLCLDPIKDSIDTSLTLAISLSDWSLLHSTRSVIFL